MEQWELMELEPLELDLVFCERCIFARGIREGPAGFLRAVGFVPEDRATSRRVFLQV